MGRPPRVSCSRFVSNNPVPRGELPALIQTVHETLARLSAGGENSTSKEEPKEPAVSIRKSVTPGYLICMEDSKHFKSLKRHLAAHGLTPEQYRAKWKLPSDYPMVAANYAASRSAMAKAIGLGQLRGNAGRASADARQRPCKSNLHRRQRHSRPARRRANLSSLSRRYLRQAKRASAGLRMAGLPQA
jgi:predicted transcriptional regulator